MRRGPRLLAPAVVQTSAMDCGPAALTSLLRGFGRPAQLEAMHDICRTGVDGTSIDVMTELSRSLGLTGRQLMVPADHLRSDELGLLPAIAVVELPGSLLHFVVLWRRFGRWVQVMDPAIGRRWVRWDDLRGQLFVHAQEVPADAWRQYAATPAFTTPLREQLERIGASPGEAEGMVADALADPGWEPIARLDAAARAGSGLGDVRDGGEPPAGEWMVRPAVDEGRLVLTGVVVLTIDGPNDDGDPALEAKVFAPEPSPVTALWSLLGLRARVRWWTAATLAVVAAAVAPLLVFWIEHVLQQGSGGWTPAIARLVVACGVVAVASAVGYRGVLATGRTLELGLRDRLDARIGRLPDRFFRTRPASDLAERVHGMHRLRDFPLMTVETGAAAARLFACLVGIVIVNPGAWWVAVALGVVAAGTPALASPRLAETEHRSRTIAGALSHVYLDTLTGLFPVRAHRAGAAVGFEHTALLEPWRRTNQSFQRTVVGAVLATQLAGYAIALWLVQDLIDAHRSLSDVLLVGFFSLVSIDAALTSVLGLRRIAPQWAVARRLLALTTHELDDEPGPAAVLPCSFALQDATVVADGTEILRGVDLTIGRGEHLAVVGPSGSGKSTLLSVLLGWGDVESGAVLVDGRALDSATGVRLRSGTAWVDADAAIWTGTVADNIGTGEVAALAIEAVELGQVVDRLGGVDGSVGESGRLLSGGEAQRLRIARAMCQPSPRLVVLDEAFRGLDADQRDRLLDRCRAWWRDTTLVWVTHHVDATLDWPRVVVVDAGRIAEDGDPAALVGAGGTFARLVDGSRRVRERLRPGAGWAAVGVAGGQVLERGQGSGTGPVETGGWPARDDASAGRPATGPRARRGAVGAWAALGIVSVALDLWAFVLGWQQLTRAADGPTGSGVPWWSWFLMSALLAACSNWAIGRAGIEIGSDLRVRILDGVLHSDVDLVRRAGASERLGRVLEADAYEQVLLTGVSAGLVGAAQLVAAFVVAWVVGLPGALVAALAGWTALTLVLVLAVRHTRGTWGGRRVQLTGLLTERFRGHRTEQVYGAPSGAGAERLAEYEGHSRRLDATRSLLIGFVTAAWLAVGLAVSLSVCPPRLALAGVGVCLLALGGFGSATVGADDLVTAFASRRQFQALFATPGTRSRGQDPPMRTGDPGSVSSTSEVGLTGVTFTYPGADRPAVRDASIRLAHGEHLLLTGPSGGGKTTVASLIAGIRAPDQGTSSGSERAVYVPQFGDNHAFQASMAYNLLLGVSWPPEGVDWDAFGSVLDELRLTTVIERMPRGLGQPIGESGWQLSHGERTRVYLARALLQRPDVVVLDETLSGLDPATALEVIDYLRNQVPTLVVITHP